MARFCGMGLGSRLLASVLSLSMLAVAEGVEVCRVSDLRLVTQTGEFFLAAGFIIMGVSTILLVMLSFKASPEKRQYFFTPCFITAIGCFSYYAMLSGQSWLITPNCRQMFYVRYLDLAVTMPLAALAIGMVAGADKATIAAVMGGCAMLVFSAFMAAITGGFIKWLWFVMHLAVLAALMAALLVSFKSSATRRHPSVPELVSKLTSLLMATWAIAPLVFVCAAGLGYWSPNFEILIYCLLDVASKVAFGFVLLLSHEAIDNAAGIQMFAPLEAKGYGTQPPRQSSRAVESYI